MPDGSHATPERLLRRLPRPPPVPACSQVGGCMRSSGS